MEQQQWSNGNFRTIKNYISTKHNNRTKHHKQTHTMSSAQRPPPQTHYLYAASMQDADIVVLAIYQLAQYKKRLEQDISRERGRLENRSFPPWQSRDQVKSRLGRQYWYHNPAPKLHHAKLRQADETALKAIDCLLQQMQRLGIGPISVCN